ncbi:MAG: hypothetical protein JXA18_04795 [Chitinispirillaceae bacterium]|nr:hypothetical protein [Chitinispirillaceae bacterium]
MKSISLIRSTFTGLILSAMLSCDCDMQTLLRGYPESKPSDLQLVIDSARVYSTTPDYDYTAHPDSVVCYSIPAVTLTYLCSGYSSTGGISSSQSNYATVIDAPDESTYVVHYRAADTASCTGVHHYGPLSGILQNPDSLILHPYTDSVYVTAFKDIDSSYVLIYQSCYLSHSYGYPYCCQVFKEGIGLIYETYRDGQTFDGRGKRALLRKINDSIFDIENLLARIMGMQKKVQEDFQAEPATIVVTGSEFDSIQGKKNWLSPPDFTLTADTTIRIAESSYYLYLFSPDTIIDLYTGNYRHISISGATYSTEKKLHYHFGGW